ncbi:Norsolorinic acid reductase A, partial [Hyphodiscus hymeniophilus]
MANPFPVAPGPFSALHRHRILSPTAGVKVSPLCLGSMNFGNAWKAVMGDCDKETAFEMMDFFHAQGGNFIDTSNNYQGEESEEWIGEWMAERGVRDQMIIATKYTTFYATHLDEKAIRSNYGGNSAKSLHVSVKASLKKIRTDYIDVLYVHWWEYTTSVGELMHSLNSLVESGKVLYLGISDTPAWIVSKANEYARSHGLRPFSVYQGRWSAALRDFERDIIPMCEAEGMALAPWGALGGGNSKSEAQRAENSGRKFTRAGADRDNIVSAALEKIATRKRTLITSVALSYVMHKAPYVFPIVGGRTVDHLRGNIEALSLRLSEDDIKEIESAVPFDVGFPMNMLGHGPDPGRIEFDKVFLNHTSGHFDVIPPVK